MAFARVTTVGVGEGVPVDGANGVDVGGSGVNGGKVPGEGVIAGVGEASGVTFT
jgi:hypothetical protein